MQSSIWTPPDGQFSSIDHYIDCCCRFFNSLDFERSLTRRYTNLSQSERRALRNLHRYADVVITPAYKGGAVVVWSLLLYIQEATRQLPDNRFYEVLHTNPLQEYQQKVKSMINDMVAMCTLPPSAKHLVTSCFYLLPKIHKLNIPGRPIVLACSCSTENISAYLDKVLAPFIKAFPPVSRIMPFISLTLSGLIPLMQDLSFYSPWRSVQ